MLSEAAAHAAFEAKDARFDGRFFTGVTSTGIYCRCVCPARTPKRENRRFFPSAAAAEGAGFRPCLLCRPERAPGLAPIDAKSRIAAEALALIEAGALEERGMAGLAGLLGVSDRHLRRAMLAAYGAAPIALAQTHRLLTAKRLLRETCLPLSEIAFAAGFGSVRRFNAAFQQRYRLSPLKVRAQARRVEETELSLDLASRGPLDASTWLTFAAGRVISGMEQVEGGVYRRLLRLGSHTGLLTLAPHRGSVGVRVSEGLAPAIRPLLAAIRGALDLDADMAAIDAVLDACARLPRDRGARISGYLDPFEAAVRAVAGQQVTVAYGRTLTERLVERFGEPVEPMAGLSRLFPTPERLAQASVEEIASLGMPGRRAACLIGLAQAVAEGRCVLQRGAVTAGRLGLERLKGFGPWSVGYVALRGLGDPDAFPVGDAALANALGVKGKAMAGLVDGVRPWRGYACMRLWRLQSGLVRREEKADVSLPA
ncbi:MAG: helix-turn-helix domain-containing protein [Hyphomonadaceae bacterium]|nr:helix-turn-helix domain-containing protein [Hyphomonadaceae bacterium]